MAKILGIISSTSQKEINYLESLVILLVLVDAVFGLLNFNSFNSLCTVNMLESGSFAADGLAGSNLFHTPQYVPHEQQICMPRDVPKCLREWGKQTLVCICTGWGELNDSIILLLDYQGVCLCGRQKGEEILWSVGP
jgi:hypothetical protein